MRITKDRDTRRAELVDASMALFLSKGYDGAMVSDVVKRVGVAQGTFYYYFKTKEDVLDAVLERLLGESAERAARLVADDFQSAAERLQGLFRMLFSPRGSVDMNPRYGRFLREPAVRVRLDDVQARLLQPVLKRLLECGAESGEFTGMRAPGELAEIILKDAAGFARGRMGAGTAEAEAAMDNLAEFMERLLGMPEHSLDFKDIVIRRRA
jgi:AcrR family transcriptional regulator